ncbi:NAD-dependent epimerase/dehydratase family protein [Umezawaea beigongshangensis]|uniref:NAD-dependent epimerase/dehydratase family protein n=1 Tax=Umezawaea beigongshangensis TaxID=2780383 RepID=UPI0018F18EB9|nr:NAD-dependent epimerase/dehydratase family protein [Umezawaea beigongshangensis]
MRVLLTGAAGCLGLAVARRLLDDGHRPVVLVHRTEFTGLDGVEVVRGDVLDAASLVPAVAGVDGVVHLAALTGIRASLEQPLLYHRVNAGGTLNLLDALAATPSAPRLVLFSTAAVYGSPAAQPVREDAPRAPGTPYAASKVAAEDAVREAADAGRIGAAVLRVFNAAGALAGRGDVDDSRVVTRAVGVASGRLESMSVFGDGSAVRDFVHVRDVASAAVLALEHCRTGEQEVFNVGATPAAVRDVVAATERVTDRAVRLEHRPANPAEAPELRAGTTRLREVLGWRPEHSDLDRIVADQWAFELTR